MRWISSSCGVISTTCPRKLKPHYSGAHNLVKKAQSLKALARLAAPRRATLRCGLGRKSNQLVLHSVCLRPAANPGLEPAGSRGGGNRGGAAVAGTIVSSEKNAPWTRV